MNCLKHLVFGAALVLVMNSATQAQEKFDMKKFTCAQLLGGSANAMEGAIWLSGYYNGLRKNTVMDINRLKQNAELVVVECKANPKNTVMQTIDTLLSGAKKK